MGIKVLFTVVYLVGIAYVALLPSGVDLAGPDWKWRGGRKDLFRNVIHREDGSLRRYSRHALIAFYVLLLVLNWVL